MEFFKFINFYIILLFIITFFIFFIGIYFRKKNNNNNSNNNNTITNIPISNYDLKLKDVCIKSSYNSLYSNHYVSLDNLNDILLNGCRFIDLEIFYIDNDCYVGYSEDINDYTLTSKNKILLSDVFYFISMNAFTSPINNMNDPLFILLRVKTKNKDTYSYISKYINKFFNNRLYKYSVNQNTILKDIVNKIIFVMDKSINPNYNNYYMCENEDCYISNYINIDIGGNTWIKYNIDDELNIPYTIINDDFKTTNSKNLKILFPNSSKYKKVYPYTIYKYGIQTILMKFYEKNNYLNMYENLFNEYNTAFIPLSTVINKINNEKLMK